MLARRISDKRRSGLLWIVLPAILFIFVEPHLLNGKSSVAPSCSLAIAVGRVAQSTKLLMGDKCKSYAMEPSHTRKRRVRSKEESTSQDEGERSKRVEKVLENIKRGPPFPYKKDGTEFRNAEGRLPHKPRGYYREYTVPPPPGTPNRGAERLVVGKDGEVYYTADHYKTFKRIK